ncbi:conserved Plasmodium protein, unknown function [Plasmodium gallinaceum]|uniref:Mediator of RNA polymerase II transcription subunit 10 n=1 Tax=Plasmodium gallinaceum TaxID=5849 RepID=A0A1J1H3W6_PLAGA|nr:conserved Plasmodium protein, unknown function [Plasmodium gallinaceum]CRG98042.1 conserved Plasmodium protein, unknown function [Plasmodium gallinaceum]
MEESKGRIKLKINIGNDEDNNVKITEQKSSIVSDDNHSKENIKDDNSYISDKKLKEKNLEKKIISIISKLTKISCICENKRNNLNNDDNAKMCKKLVKQMYKYEKCLINLNSYINDKNHNLDDITFPSGLIKAIDNYISGDTWIYKYLLLECKKHNDKYRNLIQNISAFNSTLKSKIVNNNINDITMPIYAGVSEKKLSFLKNDEKNYYKNVHIPKELAEHYLKNFKKRKIEEP